jgi:hypothetical protein
MSNTSNTPTREPQALYRYHIGLVTQHGEPCNAQRQESARALFLQVYPDGHTYTDGAGVYKGGSEAVWIVEVYAPDTARERQRARTLATQLRDVLDQECIGLAILPGSFLLV